MGPRHAAIEKHAVARVAGAPAGVGARVRGLRTGAGLTQAELGGDRFTKEYVSQVELGKTRPSDAALAWFAQRLGVERAALEGDGGASARAACEAGLARAEAEIEAHRYDRALAELEGIAGRVARS